MKILFQGDSVTDAGRDRLNPHDLGNGYPRYAAAMIQDIFPDEEFEFVNLGISGDRTADLVNRLKTDFVDEQPDIVSIMIGINDVWHRYLCDLPTTGEELAANLRKVLTAIRERTHAKIMLIQPFLLDTEEWKHMRPELEEKQSIIRALADEFADLYLPMDEIFHKNGDAIAHPLDYTAEGVHPTSDGAFFIGEAYAHAIEPLIRAVAAEAD